MHQAVLRRYHVRGGKQINRSHTHTHRQRTTPPTPTHTRTRQEQHPKPQPNTSHKHLTTLEGGATTVRVTSHARVGGRAEVSVSGRVVWVNPSSVHRPRRQHQNERHLSVCVLSGSPVWPSPPVVGPLWGPPLCVGPLWVGYCRVRVPCGIYSRDI